MDGASVMGHFSFQCFLTREKKMCTSVWHVIQIRSFSNGSLFIPMLFDEEKKKCVHAYSMLIVIKLRLADKLHILSEVALNTGVKTGWSSHINVCKVKVT